MGNDIEPITRAHFTPSLFTMGPPMKQTGGRAPPLANVWKLLLEAAGIHTDGKHGISDCGRDV